MHLNQDDLRDIADCLLDAADDIDRYLAVNSLSADDHKRLSDNARKLYRASAILTTRTVDLVIDDMAEDSAQIKAVIVEAKDSLAKLEQIGRFIRVVAGLVDIATGIAERDPKAVFKAFKGLHETVTENRT